MKKVLFFSTLIIGIVAMVGLWQDQSLAANISCSTFLTQYQCNNTTYCYWEDVGEVCEPKKEVTPTPTPVITNSITQAPVFNVNFNNSIISGSFDAGVQIVNKTCSIFSFTGITYKIDNSGASSLPQSCWTKKVSGACAGGGGDPKKRDPNYREYDPKDPFPGITKGIFEELLSIFRSPHDLLGSISEDPGEGTGGGSDSTQYYCPQCTANQYQFNSGCSINTANLSSGSHTLYLVFATDSPVKSSYTKTFTFSKAVTPTVPIADCDENQNGPSNGNSACIAKYGLSKSCCHNNICEKCGGGVVATSTPIPTATPTPSPSVLIQDLSSVFSAQNSTKNGKEGSRITASPGDVIKFSIRVTSTGKNEVKNTLVKASLPGKIIFQDGSLAVDGQRISGDFFGRGLDIGTLAAGQGKTVSFEAMVATQSQFTANSQETLTPSVVTQGVGVMAKTNSVSLTVGAGKVVSEMSLDASARNVTKNTSLTRNLEANPGDVIEFRLATVATGEGAVSAAKIVDSLPSALTYVAGSTKVDGVSAADGVVGRGISLGNLERNNSRVVTFSAKVSDSYDYSIGENYFQNIGKVSASNVSAITDYFDIKIIREAIADSKMSVGARLSTSAQYFYSRSLSANPGQQVEFAVKIMAQGEGDLNNVVLKSNFPSKLSYVKGSSSIDDQKVDDSITSGLSVGNIALGSYKIITFHAVVSGSSLFNYGNTSLIDELIMTADNVDATVKDVTINVNRYKPQASPSPTLELMAYNETQGQDATTVSSKSGDVIWFVMLAKNDYSTIINNYEIKNDISDLLKIGSVVSNGGGTVVNGQLSYPAANIPSESVISKELKIKINEAKSWNDVLQVSNTFGNTAIINLEKSIVIPEPKIEVTKRVINTTWSNGTETSVEARPNDQLEFVVEVTNTSPVMVGDVKVVDNLPAKLTYVSGDESASYNSLTGEVLWELGALVPGEKKELRLLASVSSDAFIPSEFSLTSKAEASNGIDNISFDSNSVKAGISSFVNPYADWIKIVGGAVALILLVVFGYILYKKFIKKRDTNEYLPIGKN
ncbi:MAG TPA: hypothetical protein PLQ44_02415 [Candidatus Paceibacterota bacterium]|nr:hypothetical protein [Candidatus Paceibacterota bacterium]HPT40432.1 hypothetical protein [Candidatus Paceibacterota bacterium]